VIVLTFFPDMRLFEMFRINLSSFEERKELAYIIKKEEISFEEDIKIEDGMRIDITLTKDGESSVIVEGSIDGKILINCGRCIEEYSHPVKSVFATIFKDKNEITDDDKESDINEFSNHSLDLYEYIRDTLILEMPVKPLCTEECKGLCPECGKNRNKEKCDCKKE